MELRPSNMAKLAVVLLLVSACLSGVCEAQQRLTTVMGRVTWDIPEGRVNIGNAKVQVMDHGSSPSARRISEWTSADASRGEYKVNVGEGLHDVVACDNDLTYVPQRKPVNGPEVDFRLKRYTLRVLARPLPVQFGGSKVVVYLKHLETGCEFDAMPADGRGVVLIPNTIDQTTFFARYDYCVDDKVEEEEDSQSPFESCRKRELPVGLKTEQVVSKLNAPLHKIRRSDREWIFVYKDTKVTLTDGRVSDVKVEIEPAACLLGMGCSGN